MGGGEESRKGGIHLGGEKIRPKGVRWEAGRVARSGRDAERVSRHFRQNYTYLGH